MMSWKMLLRTVRLLRMTASPLKAEPSLHCRRSRSVKVIVLLSGDTSNFSANRGTGEPVLGSTSISVSYIRAHTRLDEVSVLMTGWSVLESDPSPTMSRPPDFGWSAVVAAAATTSVGPAPGAAFVGAATGAGATGAHAVPMSTNADRVALTYPSRVFMSPPTGA